MKQRCILVGLLTIRKKQSYLSPFEEQILFVYKNQQRAYTDIVMGWIQALKKGGANLGLKGGNSEAWSNQMSPFKWIDRPKMVFQPRNPPFSASATYVLVDKVSVSSIKRLIPSVILWNPSSSSIQTGKTNSLIFIKNEKRLLYKIII